MAKSPRKNRIEDAQRETRSGGHSGLTCWKRSVWTGKIPGRLSSEDRWVHCCPGFRNDPAPDQGIVCTIFFLGELVQPESSRQHLGHAFVD